MEINREINKITGWKTLQKWARFHDLELYKLSKTSTIFSIAILIIELIQRLSLIMVNFPLESKMNRMHRQFYSSVTEVVNLKKLIQNYKDIFTISVGVYLVIKMILTIYFYYIAQTVDVLRQKFSEYLRFFEFLKFLDLTIFLIPIVKDSFLNFFSPGKLELKLISCGNLIILLLEFLYIELLSIDIKYIKTNLFQGRDKTLKILKFFGTIIITFFHIFNSEILKEQNFGAFVNFLNLLLGLWILLDLNTKLHFLQLHNIRYVNLVIYLLYTVESLFSLIFFFYPTFIRYFDMDYMIIVVFMLVVNLCLLLIKKREDKLSREYIYGIESIQRADQYMENMAYLLKRTNDKHNRLELFSLLNLHFEKCVDLRCLCFLLKYPVKRARERRLIDHLIKNNHKSNNQLKLILYDDVVAMTHLREEHQKKITEDFDKEEVLAMETEEKKEESEYGEDGNEHYEHKNGFYLVDLNSKDIPTVFAGFYHILIKNFHRKDPFLLFQSYLSFLVYEVNNYVGTLINTYNYIFSQDYKKDESLFKNIVLMNYIDLSSKRLHKEFLDSPYWLSSNRITNIFNFSERIDEVERKFVELVRLNTEFYEELSGSSINFKYLINSGKEIHDIKEWMEKEFEELFEITKDNSKLISLYINFQLNINFESDESLSEYYEKLHFLYKTDIYKSLQELADKNQKMNLFSNKNMIVFVNILKSKFYISKFSSNTPGFFGMDDKELKGKSLSDLMPLEISKDHDRYVLDFVNQRKSPIIKTASLTSFAMTKSGDLKIVSVIVKVEYLMTDDVYLCGIIVPHPKNKEVLILSNLSGKIIGMNKKARKLLGTMIIDNPYSLFISIPLLVKYFYPEVEKQLRYSKFSLRRQKKNVVDEEDKNLGMNFKLDTEEFGAFFFKYMLSEKIKYKGIVQDSKSGILSNFGFDDLQQWSFLKDINSKMLMPKHIRILSRVIAKNRQLMKNHSDEILTTYVSIDTYKHRGNLTFKLIGLSGISSTNEKVKKFFIEAAEKLKGEMADVFMVAPKDINNLCKDFF